MYTEVLLRPKSLEGQRVYPGDARRMVAKALDGDTAISPVLFGRDESGKTAGRRINHLPPVAPIVFDGGTGFVRIYGVGQTGREVLMNDLGRIVSGLSSYTGGPVAMDLRKGDISFAPKGYRTYRIARLAMAKQSKVRGEKFFTLWKRYNATGETEREAIFQEAVPLIKGVIDTGLAAMADQNGIDLPQNLDIKILSGELAVSRIHPGSPGHVGIVRNLCFSMLGHINGPWSVGHLRSYGFGLIRREIAR